MAADRSGLAERQAQLLRSLIRGEDFPAGFAAEQAAAASLSLRRKRGPAVAAAWPALAQALGDAFEPRFDAFARRLAAPAVGGGLADGLAFVRDALTDVVLPDEVRVELLLARARFRRGRGRGRVRGRRAFLGGIALREPRRLLVVCRVPVVGVRHVGVPLPQPGRQRRI